MSTPGDVEVLWVVTVGDIADLQKEAEEDGRAELAIDCAKILNDEEIPDDRKDAIWDACLEMQKKRMN